MMELFKQKQELHLLKFARNTCINIFEIILFKGTLMLIWKSPYIFLSCKNITQQILHS